MSVTNVAFVTIMSVTNVSFVIIAIVALKCQICHIGKCHISSDTFHHQIKVICWTLKCFLSPPWRKCPSCSLNSLEYNLFFQAQKPLSNPWVKGLLGLNFSLPLMQGEMKLWLSLLAPFQEGNGRSILNWKGVIMQLKGILRV